MSVERWNEIFELLSMVILADKRVYKEEVDTFVDSVMSIKAAVNDDTLITRDLAFEWFRGHREDILALSQRNDFDIVALKRIIGLKGFEYRKALLRAMLDVSIADDELHSSEESLISLASAHWGIKITSLGPKYQ